MTGRRVLAITRRLLAQMRHDRRTLALLFVAPLIILGLFDALLRGGATLPDLGVVNLDRGPLGAAVEQRLVVSDQVRATAADEASARRRLDDGSVAGYVVLPPDMSAVALRTHALSPQIHLEGSTPGPATAVLQAVQTGAAAALADTLIQAGTAAPRLAPQVDWRYGGPSLDTLDYFGGAFIGLVVFFLVFVVTCVSFLRERSQGTLERLMASPLRRAEMVAGYMLGFLVLALAQATEVVLFALYVLRVHNAGGVSLIFVIEGLLALAAVNLGVFLSMFARSEFQVMQFIPLVIVPQVLLSGVIVPVASEPRWLQWLSDVLPLTYAVSALRDVMIRGGGVATPAVELDAAVLLAFCVAAVAAAAASLSRRLA